jgi:hypothetical protein
MIAYGLWCNEHQAWFTNSRDFVKGGLPKLWSTKRNALYCKNDKEGYYRRFYRAERIDLVIVRVQLEVAPMDKYLIRSAE